MSASGGAGPCKQAPNAVMVGLPPAPPPMLSHFKVANTIVAKAQFAGGRTIYVRRYHEGFAYFALAQAVRRELLAGQ